MKYVHIAGTNGKGSVAEYISHILTAAGERCGCFTSPHLISPTERMRIDGRQIDKDELDALMTEVRREELAVNDTLFAAYTAAALLWFERQQVDWAVMETGLGGRLDPTNVIHPAVTVLTSIDIDHADVLGTRIEDIAAEKAGIIKPGVPVVAASQRQEVRGIITEQCRKVDAPVTFINRVNVVSASLSGQAFEFQGRTYTIRSIGNAQPGNAALAVQVCQTLGTNESAIAAGLADVTLLARIQYIKGVPDVILDGAHNPAAAKMLANALTQYVPNRKKVFLIACMQNKDWRGVIDALQPHIDSVIITQADPIRGTHPNDICAYMPPQISCETDIDPVSAFKKACTASKENDAMLVVTGSLYLAGIIRRQFIQE